MGFRRGRSSCVGAARRCSTLNWLPIGGFVRLEGEDGDSEDPRSFVRQPLRTRLLILLAGVAMNFLLAWVIFTFIAAAGDPVVGCGWGVVQPGSPAASIGLVGGVPEWARPRRKGVPVYDDSKVTSSWPSTGGASPCSADPARRGSALRYLRSAPASRSP
ncbi:MAG: site-2 protease family protein [Chloroflexota bacterium]